MKLYLTVGLWILSCVVGNAQRRASVPVSTPVVAPIATIAKADIAKLKRLEDSLVLLSNIILYDTTVHMEDMVADYAGAMSRAMASGKKDTTNYFPTTAKYDSAKVTTQFNRRKAACYRFIPKLVNALKIDNSYYHNFDSVTILSTVYPPDSSFKIMTWQLHYPMGRFRYYGVIQMKSQKLKLFPLRDLRDTLSFHSQAHLTADNWYGQLYYRIIEKTVGKKTIYTLFGFEAADFISRRKIIDILTFDEKGNPQFGAPLFVSKDTNRFKKIDTLNRFFIEYKWSAAPNLNYDNDLEMIVFDHLAPPNPKAQGVYFAYVQDGTYEGYKWEKNHWQWVEKVFTFAINENDNPPIPSPLFGVPKKQPVLPDKIEKP